MTMLGFAIGALIISLIAGALGFTGVAHAAASVDKIVFGVFLVIAVILFVLLALGIGALPKIIF
jgi:uncharacterized membrane protein YtjA (UPF0391 family)